MAVELDRSERETHLNMTGDNHDVWEVFSDDPFMIRRIEALGVKPIEAVGAGFIYQLSADQVLLRKGKRKVSDAQREAMRANAHFGVKITSGTRDFEVVAQ